MIYKFRTIIYDQVMLTKSDLKLIQELFTDSFNDSFEEAHNKLRDTNAIFKDQIVGEIKKLREDVIVTTGYRDRISDLETKVESIEKVLDLPQT